MKKRLAILLALTALASLCGCSKATPVPQNVSSSTSVSSSEIVSNSAVVSDSEVKEPAAPTIPLGSWNGNTYINEEIGLSINFPEDWYPNPLYAEEDPAQSYEDYGYGIIAAMSMDFHDSITISAENSRFDEYSPASIEELAQSDADDLDNMYNTLNADDFDLSITEIGTVTVQGEEYLYFDTRLEFTYMYETEGFAYIHYGRQLYREVNGNYIKIVIETQAINLFEEFISILEGK